MAAGVVAWLVFLIATIPADRALALAPPMPGIVIGSVQGTVWSGHTGRIVAQGVAVDDVRWRFRPLSLFLGKLEFGLHGRLDKKPLQTLAGLTFSGAPYLKDVHLGVAAAEVLYRLGVKQLSVAGQLSVDLDDVRFPPDAVPVFSGKIVWAPADVKAPLALSLGSVTLITQHSDTTTEGKLVASGGALQVQADVALEATGAYRLDATIQQNGTVPQAVTKFLTTFADDENGSYRLKWSDTL